MRRGRGDAEDSRIDVAYEIAYALPMRAYTATKARQNLYRLIDEVAESSEPISITGRRGNAVMISEDDWRAIEETLYLLSIPGMRDSIRAGMAEPLSKSAPEPGW